MTLGRDSAVALRSDGQLSLKSFVPRLTLRSIRGKESKKFST